nr:MAG TPA: tail tape measure [Caudoviricetes sp.]
MATSIDYRIVEAQFRNSNFEKNIAQSTESLERFKRSLDVDQQAKSLEKLDNAADLAGMKGLAQQVDKVADKFSAMGVVAFTALQRITNAAIDTGVSLVKSLSIDQITAGWNKYEQKTSNVQTLVNATGKSVEDINGYLEKLMMFSDETSYDFTTMAQSLGQMVTSGGNIDRLIPMIEGIANATSFAGKGAAEFSRSIYNLNQSYGQGYLTLMDWRSVELSGVASQQLKETFIDVGKALGTLDKNGRTAKGTLVDIGNFSTTLADKWASREVMEQAFGRFAQVTEAAYKLVQAGMADTYSEAYAMLDGAFEQVYYRAALAAQEAKTFGEAINSVKDAVSSGWMTTFDYIFGGYDKAKEIWTNLANDLWDVFAAPAQERNSILKEWVELGGQTALWEGLTNIFKSLLSVIEAIREGFSEIFPAKTGQQLADLTFRFRDFSEKLIASEGTLAKVKEVASGLASIVKLMITPIKLILGLIGKIITQAAPLTSYLLSFSATIGGLLTNLVKMVDESRVIEGIFSTLKSAVEAVGGAFMFLGGMLSTSISAFTGINVLDINNVTTSLAEIPPIGEQIAKVFDTIGESGKNAFGKVSQWVTQLKSWATSAATAIGTFAKSVAATLKPIGDRIKSIFEGVTLTDAIGTTLLFGLYEQIKKMAKALAAMKTNWAGVTKALTNVLNTAGDTLKAFQNKVNAEVLKSIAISVGILAASLFLISRVKPENMGKSLAAVALLFGELTAILGIMSGKKMTAGKAELLTLAGALIGMSVAISILAGALAKLTGAAKDTWVFAKATLAIIAILVALEKVGVALSTKVGEKQVMKLALVFLSLATAVRILASAFEAFKGIGWTEFAMGIASLMVGIGAITGSIAVMKVVPGQLTSVASSLVAFGLAMSALILPIKILGEMDPKFLEQGLIATAKLLGGVVASITLLSIATKGFAVSGKNNMFAQTQASLVGLAKSLFALSVSISLLVVPLRILGSLPFPEIKQGLISVGLLMTGLTASLSIMGHNNVAGTASGILAFALALNMLVIPIKAFSTLNLPEIGAGLLTLTGAIALMLGSAFGLGVLAKTFAGLEKSMLAFGLAALGVGAAVAALSVLLGTLSAIGAAGVAAIVAAIAAFFQAVKVMLPVIEEGLTDILITIGHVLKRGAPAVVEGLIVMFDEAMKQLREYAPSLIASLGDLIVILINGLSSYAPQIRDALKNLFAVWFGDTSREEVILDILASATALVAVLKMLSIAKAWGKDAIIGAGFAAAATLILGGALAVLENLGNTDKMLTAALALGTIITAMSVAMRIAEPLGNMGLGALKGIAMVVGVVTALSALFGAFQAFFGENEVVKKIMDGNIKFMEYIGTALGSFIGGIKKGISDVVGEKDSFLTKFGKDLKEFWSNASVFFQGINGLKDSVFSNMVSLGEAMLIFTGTKFLDGLASIIGRSDLLDFSKQLADSAPYLKTFYTEVGVIDQSSIENAIYAIGGMAEAASKIPTFGGLKGTVFGNSFIASFAAELDLAAPHIKGFLTKSEGLPADSKTLVDMVSDIVTTMATAVAVTPKYSAFKAFFTGENLISLFAAELALAAPNMVDFLNTMAGAPANGSEIAMKTSNIIANLAIAVNQVPNTGAARSKGSLSNFAKQLKDMGEALVQYSDVVAGVNTSAMDAASEALANLVKSIQNADVLATIQQKLKDVESGIYIVVTNIANNIFTQFSNRTGEYKDIGMNYLKGIRNGLMDVPTVNSLTGAARDIAKAIDRTVRDELDIHSPSGQGKLIGKYYDMGVRYGLDGSKKTVLVAARNLANEMLKNGEITYQELQEVYNKFNTSIASAENKRLFVLNAMNRTSMGELKEIVGDGYDDIVKETYDAFHQTGTAIDESSEELSQKAGTAGKKTGQSFIDGLSSKLSLLGTQLTGRSLEYQVWEKLYGDTASDADKRAANAALLESQLNLQVERLNKAGEKYAETIKKYGKTSSEAASAYNELLQEQLATAEKAQELQSSQQTVVENNRSAIREYAKWMAEYKDGLLQMGFSLEEIQRAAQRDTGYDPSIVMTGISNATSVATDAMEKVKQSFANSANDVAGSLTPIYLEYGKKSAEALGEGIQNGSQTVENSTVDVLENTAEAASVQTSKFVPIGEVICEKIGEGIDNGSWIVTEKIDEMLSKVSFASGSGATSYANNLSSGLQVINSDVMDNLDTSLTITPVIDDSKVRSGLSTIGSLITGLTPGGRALNLVSKIAAGVVDTTNGIMTENVTNNYNFNQTNNSPKALTRAEIYRDSKNLMSQLETKTS